MSPNELAAANTVRDSVVASSTARSGQGPASVFRRWTKRRERRHYHIEKRRHERQEKSDSYIDRHGTPHLPIDVIAATLMR